MGFGGSTGPQSHYPVAQPAHLGPDRLAALLCLHHTYLYVWRNVSWGLHPVSLAGGSDFCCRPLKLLPCFHQMYIMAGKVLQPFYCMLLFIHSLRCADVQYNMKFSLLVCSLEVFSLQVNFSLTSFVCLFVWCSSGWIELSEKLSVNLRILCRIQSSEIIHDDAQSDEMLLTPLHATDSRYNRYSRCVTGVFTAQYAAQVLHNCSPSGVCDLRTGGGEKTKLCQDNLTTF